MSFKNVEIPVCTECSKEGPYDYQKKIPTNWVGILANGSSEIKYIYGKDGESKTMPNSRTTSSSCYIPNDSLFCSFKCYERFMVEKIKNVKSSMSGIEA